MQLRVVHSKHLADNCEVGEQPNSFRRLKTLAQTVMSGVAFQRLMLCGLAVARPRHEPLFGGSCERMFAGEGEGVIWVRPPPGFDMLITDYG